MEEGAEKERRREERERKRKKEQERRVRKQRNVIWIGIKENSSEERRMIMARITEKVLGRKVKVKRVEERVGEGGKEILLAEMEKEGDKEELLEKRGEIRSKWEVIVDEDLTMEERKLKWRIVEKARMERRKGRKEVINNRKI